MDDVAKVTTRVRMPTGNRAAVWQGWLAGSAPSQNKRTSLLAYETNTDTTTVLLTLTGCCWVYNFERYLGESGCVDQAAPKRPHKRSCCSLGLRPRRLCEQGADPGLARRATVTATVQIIGGTALWAPTE